MVWLLFVCDAADMLFQVALSKVNLRHFVSSSSGARLFRERHPVRKNRYLFPVDSGRAGRNALLVPDTGIVLTENMIGGIQQYTFTIIGKFHFGINPIHL
jgi:hypothetical protein